MIYELSNHITIDITKIVSIERIEEIIFDKLPFYVNWLVPTGVDCKPGIHIRFVSGYDILYNCKTGEEAITIYNDLLDKWKLETTQ